MGGYQGTATRRDGHEGHAGSLDDLQAGINTTAMGEVVSYDTKTQTATIQPRLSKIIGGEKVRAPQLIEVPVMHPRAGGMIIHKPLKAGDEVKLDFAQRPLNGDGEDSEDGQGTMHSMSDAVAHPASYSKGKQLPDLPSDRMHFGSEDGKSGLQMKEDGTFDLVKGGDTVFKIIEDTLKVLRDHLQPQQHNMRGECDAILARVTKMKAP